MSLCRVARGLRREVWACLGVVGACVGGACVVGMCGKVGGDALVSAVVDVGPQDGVALAQLAFIGIAALETALEGCKAVGSGEGSTAIEYDTGLLPWYSGVLQYRRELRGSHLRLSTTMDMVRGAQYCVLMQLSVQLYGCFSCTARVRVVRVRGLSSHVTPSTISCSCTWCWFCFWRLYVCNFYVVYPIAILILTRTYKIHVTCDQLYMYM